MNKLLLTTIAIGSLAGVASATVTTYDVTFEGRWTTAINPSRPGSAHFSPLIGATHNSSFNLFQSGTQASAGIELMAELGLTSTLSSEINSSISLGSADTLLTPSGNLGPEQSITFSITVDSDHSLFSMVSMIAPSADWFVGVRNFDLRSGGNWLSSAVVDLNSYDAGTESGIDFAIGGPTHMDTNDNIQLLSTAEPTGPFASGNSIARITFTQTPEPSSAAFGLIGGLAFCLRRRR